jgi:hypothetical protein
MTEWSEFASRLGKVFSLFCNVKIDSGDHPASYKMGTGGSFPRGKAIGS